MFDRDPSCVLSFENKPLTKLFIHNVDFHFHLFPFLPSFPPHILSSWLISFSPSFFPHFIFSFLYIVLTFSFLPSSLPFSFDFCPLLHSFLPTFLNRSHFNVFLLLFLIFLLSSLFLFLIFYISVVKTWESLKPFTLFDSHSFTFTVNVLFWLVCAVSTFISCFCVCSFKTQFVLMRLVNKVWVILVNAASSENVSQQDLYSDFYDRSGEFTLTRRWSLNSSSSVCIWWFCFCPIRAVRFSVCWMNGGFHTIQKKPPITEQSVCKTTDFHYFLFLSICAVRKLICAKKRRK